MIGYGVTRVGAQPGSREVIPVFSDIFHAWGYPSILPILIHIAVAVIIASLPIHAKSYMLNEVFHPF